MTALILMFGSTSGIEKVNKILMPLFFILFLILAIRVYFYLIPVQDMSFYLHQIGNN